MNASQEKIKKICHSMNITTVVFCILVAIQIILAATLVIWNEISPQNFFSQYMTGEVIARMCTHIALYFFALGILLKFRGIFTATNKSGIPFSQANAKKLKSIGVAIIVASLVVPSLEKVLLKIYAPQSVNMAGDVLPLPFVLLGIVFFLFSVLFYYGAELQQQSDETL